jgi:hypothetical protein
MRVNRGGCYEILENLFSYSLSEITFAKDVDTAHTHKVDQRSKSRLNSTMTELAVDGPFIQGRFEVFQF